MARQPNLNKQPDAEPRPLDHIVMTKNQLLELLGKLYNHEINIDKAFEAIDGELEITDTGLVYALYLDYREES